MATSRPRWSIDDLWFDDVSDDGNHFATVRSGHLELRNVSDGSVVEGFHPPVGKFSSAVFSRDGTHIVTVEGGLNEAAQVVQWNASTGVKVSESTIEIKQTTDRSAEFAREFVENLTRYGEFAIVWTVAYQFSDKRNHEFILCDTGNSRTIAHLDFADHATAQLAVSILRQATSIRALEGGGITAELYPGTAAVFTTKQAGAEIKINGAGPPLHAPLGGDLEISLRRLSPSGRLLLTSDKAGGLRLWSATTGQPLSETIWHDGFILYAQFSGGDETITTITSHASIRSYFVGEQSSGLSAWMKEAGEALTGLTLVGNLDVRELSQEEHAKFLDEFRRAVGVAAAKKDPSAVLLSSGKVP
jgi:WD40 repeat protein